MNVTEREPGDVQRLEKLVAAERHAKQRDRYRMALLALRGWEAVEIADALSSNRRTVQAWVYRYRDRGTTRCGHASRPATRRCSRRSVTPSSSPA
jgi:DNA-directed RNA polymerase specialized sigma24 family protein